MSLETDSEDAWAFLKDKLEIFPPKGCKFAVLEMHRRGFKIASATVTLDNYCNLGLKQEIPHFLAYEDSSKRFVDLTASQFNGNFKGNPLPKIGIWHEEDLPKIYHILKIDILPYQVI